MADDWQRLAVMVRERRYDDLGLTRDQVAASGGPSVTTLQHIENAKQARYRPVILRRLEQALAWERGSVRAVLDGGDPQPAAPAVTTGTAAAAGAATATAAAAGADPLSWIGQAIADEMFADEDGVWNEIRRERRRGTPEARIFTDPDEQAMWSVPVTPEEQRAANIAALRYWRRTLPPRRNSTPATLAG